MQQFAGSVGCGSFSENYSFRLFTGVHPFFRGVNEWPYGKTWPIYEKYVRVTLSKRIFTETRTWMHTHTKQVKTLVTIFSKQNEL